MSGPTLQCIGIAKRFYRYSSNRPRRIKDLVFGNWRALRPETTLWALRDVDFALEPGSMLGVIGNNGAGKSTLLRVVGGVSAPDKGQLKVRGRVGALLDLGLGFHPDLTGRENLYVNGVIAGLTRRELARRFDEIVAFAELEGFIDAPLRTYSSGMRIRLAFAIAAHTDPELLLIDEVLSVGDLAFQRKCMDRITGFKRQGTAILLVSHNLHEVRKLCDGALWLQEGRIRKHGATDEVIDAYEAAFTQVEQAADIKPVVLQTRSGVTLTHRDNRFGTLEAEITDVQAPALLQRDIPMTVDIDFVAHHPVSSPIFQLKIVRDDGLVCWETNSATSGTVIPSIQGAGRVRMYVEHPVLSKGRYWLDVGIYHHNWEHMLDYHSKAYCLHIERPLDAEGVVDLPAHWQLIDGAQHAARSGTI